MEASWHGSRVSVKQLLAPMSAGSRPGGRNGGGGGSGSRALSTASASAMRRQIRLLQALHFEFLVPIYGVRKEFIVVVYWVLCLPVAHAMWRAPPKAVFPGTHG